MKSDREFELTVTVQVRDRGSWDMFAHKEVHLPIGTLGRINDFQEAIKALAGGLVNLVNDEAVNTLVKKVEEEKLVSEEKMNKQEVQA